MCRALARLAPAPGGAAGRRRAAPWVLFTSLCGACVSESPLQTVPDASPSDEDRPGTIIRVQPADAGPPELPPVGVPCVDSLDCWPRGECWRGVCTGTCTTTADCGTDVVSSCLWVPELGGKRCVEDARRCYAVPEGRDLVGEALAAAGLDRCKVGFPLGTLGQFGLENDEFRMPYFNAVFHSGLRLRDYEDRLASGLAEAAASAAPLSGAIARAALEHGARVEPAPWSAPPSAGGAPLAQAVAALISARGGTPDTAALAADAADVPLSLQRKLAAVVHALREAALARDRMLAGLSAEEAYRYAAAYSLVRADGLALDPASGAVRRRYATGYKHALLFEGAARLAATIEAGDWASEAGAAGFAFDAATPIGRVLVRDGAVHRHAATDPAYTGDVALLVDTGGDDVYTVSAGGTSSAQNPVAVCLDLAGNDRYEYEVVPHPRDKDTPQRLPSDIDGRDNSTDLTRRSGPISFSDAPRQGAGRVGIGLLYDFSGDDRYRSLRMSQGFGALGVGGLFDAAGADVYKGEAGVQGAALFGIGILVDRAGSDRYFTWTLSQGFAGVRGLGALPDLGGADVYHADVGDPAKGGDPLYFSSHQPGMGNRSFVQGAGFGLRGQSAAASMSGGIGILVDRGGGDDSDQSSVYGQAAGYWFGSGFLDDDGGDDQYQDKVGAQGATAHFALSLLRDRGGSDRYNAAFLPVEDVLGMSHDYAVSFLIDESGDDLYMGSSWQNSIGVGLTNGMGFLLDLGGVDEYRVYNGRTLGFADVQVVEPGRTDRLTLGLLVDAAGADTYYDFDAVSDSNDRTRLLHRHPELATEVGVHLDGTGSAVALPW